MSVASTSVPSGYLFNVAYARVLHGMDMKMQIMTLEL